MCVCVCVNQLNSAGKIESAFGIDSTLVLRSPSDVCVVYCIAIEMQRSPLQ